jgi:hypothetical protein
MPSFRRLLAGLGVMLLAAAPSARAADAGCLFLSASGSLYGNRGFTNVTWGDGYPAVSAQFVTDPAIVFAPEHGSGPKQRMANNGLTPGTAENDNPAFVGTYTNVLRLNALIADTGTVALTYTFAAPMTLVDLLVTDVDQDDRVLISMTAPGGAPLSPTQLQFAGEGDLSLTLNAGGRPPAELATPPAWTADQGTVTARVTWNENRSYTILRVPEGVVVETITVTFMGSRADSDGPSGSALGAHVYVALWATPRVPAVADVRTADGVVQLRVPTLPGLAYHVLSGDGVGEWTATNTVVGPAATGHVWWAETGPVSAARFHTYDRAP